MIEDNETPLWQDMTDRRMVCYDHDCGDHNFDDPRCDHMVCTLAPIKDFPRGIIVQNSEDLINYGPRMVETVDGRIYHVTPPRPDYRWSATAHGRIRHEPDLPKFPLPAPPDVPVMVPSDIAKDVAMYAERRNAEKRLGRTP
jgi:hypothetical protein